MSPNFKIDYFVGHKLSYSHRHLEPDMSIWEVRNNKQHFVYSKIMLWVAFDRGLRLADKRCLPCPNRVKWLEARDNLYEEIMEKGNGSCLTFWLQKSMSTENITIGYNVELKCFTQSYENQTMLDSSILIAPLVFFITPNDPRFLNTVERILLPFEKGGLTVTGLVHRYNSDLSDDGESFLTPMPVHPYYSVRVSLSPSLLSPHGIKYPSLAVNR